MDADFKHQSIDGVFYEINKKVIGNLPLHSKSFKKENKKNN